jgi:hypothetical protein
LNAYNVTVKLVNGGSLNATDMTVISSNNGVYVLKVNGPNPKIVIS